MHTQHNTERRLDLGPKQKAWCDVHLSNFRIYRQGAEQVLASTEASRKAHLTEEKKQ